MIPTPVSQEKRPNAGFSWWCAAVVFVSLVFPIAAFDVHLFRHENKPGRMVFNCSTNEGRRYFLENPSPLVSQYFQIEPVTGELYLKDTFPCLQIVKQKSFQNPFLIFVGSKRPPDSLSVVNYVSFPIFLNLKDSKCTKHDVKFHEINNDFLEAEIEIVDTVTESNSTTGSHVICWKKSQEILGLSQILPLNQLRRCDILWDQPSQDGYSIEINGGQLVANRNFCSNALRWTVDFKFHVTCSDNSYTQPVRLYFQRVSQKNPHSFVHRDRSRRSTFNQSPVFENALYKVTVPEEVEGGYSVVNVSAVDPDGDQVIYTLQAALDSRSQRLFEIDSLSGQVRTTTHLDREFMNVHYLRVTAADDRLPPSIGTATVEVLVSDRNDHTPVFEQATYIASVREMSPIGSTVITVRATDQDIGENSEMEYSILNPTGDNDVFQIDQNTGVITLGKKLDREATAFYSLLVQATDKGEDPEQRSSIATIEITVLDDNDNYPQFTERTYLIDVPEDIEWTVRPVIAVVRAEDKDQGVNAAIRYAIIGGNTQGHFSIDSQSGEIAVVSPLDYETARSYRLIVRAQDGGQPSRSNTSNVILRVLDANDNDPKFYTSLIQDSVSEGVPIGHSVLRVQAYDADDGPNSEIVYSILPTEQTLPFAVDRMSGWILTTNELDREQNSFYDFEVMAKDRGSPSRSSTASVIIRVQDVNDNDPVFDPKVYSASVSEIDPPGTPVVGVTATDRDEEPRLIYHISEGNHRGRFNIIHQNREGLISVAQPLDYKIDKKFILTVTATDAGGRFDTATVHINVTDANTHRPVFEKVPYTASVPEDAAIGTTVLVVEASDGDVGENARISYFIEDNPEFTIDSTTGAISTSQPLDRELTAGFVLVVTAQDHGSPSLSDTINVEIEVLDVNDNPPTFVLPSYAASIREDALVGSSVIQVSASDKDIGLSGQVRYTFSGGEDGDGAFIVEPTSGIIRTNQLLDRESVPLYRLTVHAVDRGATPLSSAATVTVNIEDVNDNPPRFDIDVVKLFVSENSPIGSLVGEIMATDPDEGPNADIFYSIVGGPDADKFNLISRNGGPAELYTKSYLDYETSKKKYAVVVRAASPPLRNDVEVNVWVTDVNDNAPRLRDFVIVFNHHKSHFPKNPIGKVPAYDADVTDRLRYKFISGNNANLMIMNEKTGELSLSPHLDTNVPLHATMEVSVFDGINEVSAQCQLIVQHVTDAMMFNSATLRLQRMTAVTFLSPIFEDFVEGLAAIIPCPKENIFIFSIQEDNTSEERILNVSFSAKPADARHPETFFSSQYLQERVYLGRAILARLTHVHVLPFEDNLCVREPCINFEQCLSVLKFGNASDFISSDMYFFRSIIPINTFACRCPPGFTGMKHKYECDTEVNLCYSSPCLNGGTCVRREGGFSCLCKEGFTGQKCEVDFLNSTCYPGLCHGGSQCVSTNSGISCKNCSSENWSSVMCELRARSFERGTYLTFPALRQRHRLSISMKFATQERHALLLYNGRYNDEHDFISLEIINAQLVFFFSLGGHVSQVPTFVTGGVSDGQWHTAQVTYFNRSATLSVDDCDVGLSLKYGKHLKNYLCANFTTRKLEKRCSDFIQSCYRFLDLTGPLQIGGLPALQSDFQVQNKYFVGCIMDLYVDNQLVDLNSYVANNGTTTGCPQKSGFCHSSPCKNGGTCFEGWGSFYCSCPTGFIAKDCSEGVQLSKHFMGEGFIVFIPHLHPIQLPWVQRVSFRTHHDHGLLLQIKLGHNSLIIIDIVDGYLRYIFNNQDLILPDVTVNDGKWHSVEATWFPNWLLLSLDYGQYIVKKIMKANIRGMYIGKVSVGGVENPDDEGKIAFFIGCIQDVKIGTSQGTWLRPMVEVNVRDGCFSPDQCFSNPCPQNSRCIDHWGNYSCECFDGHFGTHCLPVCQLNPCSESSTCESVIPSIFNQTKKKMYHCKCDAQHTGDYCEVSLDMPCPSNWWGYPICGPCQCDINKGYSADCNKTTGECYCEVNHFQPKDSAICYSCNCYAVGSYGNGCDPVSGQCHCRPGVIGRRCDSCSNPFAEVTLRGCEVVYDSCPKAYSRGIWWPRTFFDEIVEQDCPEGSVGTATRFCSEQHGWGEPDLFGCTSLSFVELADQLGNLQKGLMELNTSLVVEYAHQLQTAVNKTFPLYGNDVLIFSLFFHQIIQHEKQKAGLDLSHRQDRYFIKNLIQAANSVLDPIYLDHWNQIAASTGRGIEMIMDSFEEYLRVLIRHFADTFTRPFELNEKNIVFGVDTVSSSDVWISSDVQNSENETKNLDVSPFMELHAADGAQKPSVIFPKYNNYPIRENFESHSAEIILPLKSIGIRHFDDASNSHVGSYKETAVVGYVIYSTMGQLIPTIFDDSVSYHGIPVGVNAPVLTVVVQSINISDDHSGQHLDARLRFRVFNSTGTSPQCVYWSTNENRGYWSSEGCEVESYERDSPYVNCSCNHLSSFTVIMEKSHNEFVPSESLVQNVVSYLAIITSLILLALTFLVFCLLRGSQTNSNTIHICLVSCIFAAELIFLIALKSRHYLVFQQFPCKMVAILLHFLFLAIFSWLLVEAIHIFRMMTNLCDINHGPMHCYFSIGFGAPALIVGLSVGVSVDQYGNHFFCWLSVHENVVWSLVGPVCVIVVVTLLVFIAALRSSLQCKDSIMDFGNLKTLLWLAVILLPIQGSTWVLAILSVNETHAILQYAFSFFCLLKGIYIFVGYCVINKKVQQQICFMWIRLCKSNKYPEINGIQSSLQSSAYHPSSKIYHRSIGISTSSATSRSTSKTCTSHCRAESEPKLSENQPSTSEMDETTVNKGIYCKHGKYYEQILRNCDYEQNKGSVKSCLDDILNGNHAHAATPCQLSLNTETNEGKSPEALKFSEFAESTSSGPKMGINMFSYPRLPGSRSPLSKTSLSLKMGLNSKDHSLSWGSVDSQKSSPLSAPVSGARPEFCAPRMGVSGVEKSILSARDMFAETNSLDSNLHLGSVSKTDFKTGICSSCRSQSLSKDTFSDFSSTDIPQYDGCSKSCYKGAPNVNKKHVRLSKEKDSSYGKKSLHNCRSEEDCEKIKRLHSADSEKSLHCILKKTKSENELKCDTSQRPLTDVKRNVEDSKELEPIPTNHCEVSPVCTQSTPDTASCFDRTSPRLIDDSPSEEESPLNITLSSNCFRNGSSNIDRVGESNNSFQIASRHFRTAPPLATAEITDSDEEL
ncbi:unnamed protein product [Larinioides sclopetarius]|uniref:Uncharacterized protein n=1 Tax=Larinioides sclopetarius TaxID=280406 RepID=A0AAV1Z747_9ARAC